MLQIDVAATATSCIGRRYKGRLLQWVILVGDACCKHPSCRVETVCKRAVWCPRRRRLLQSNTRRQVRACRRCGAASADVRWRLSARTSSLLHPSLHLDTGVAMELRRSCNELRRSRRGCVGAPSRLQWRFAGVAMKLRRCHRCCVGAPSRLQWSFAGVVGAGLELRRGCNGASANVVGAAMRLQ